MPRLHLSTLILSIFVPADEAEAIVGDLEEENGGHRPAYLRDLCQTLPALFLHRLRQTPLPLFMVCVLCVCVLRTLEMSSLFLLLFGFQFNEMPAAAAVIMGGAGIVASCASAFLFVRLVPGFGRFGIVLTASLLMLHTLFNGLLILLLSRDLTLGVAGAVGRLLVFDILFHILPLLCAGMWAGCPPPVRTRGVLRSP